MSEKKEIAKMRMKERKEETTPLFERVMILALNDKNWLVMELIARSFNESDCEVWALNTGFPFLGVTEYWVSKMAKEKGLSDKVVISLKRELIKYERLFYPEK